MTEEQALLAAVRASPADDLPRLVYADYLDEHGRHEQAEFIRTSIHHQRSKNGWMLQPHIHHKSKELFVVPWLNLKQYLYRRGFLSEVLCPLADWIGGECERCGEPDDEWYGFVRPEGVESGAWVPCLNCHGAGRIHGIGPRVVREHPVEVVKLTDREPWYHEFRQFRAHMWFRHEGARPEHADPESVLSREIWPHLLDQPHRDTSSEGHSIRYDTAELANTSLSAALIAWAKGELK